MADINSGLGSRSFGNFGSNKGISGLNTPSFLQMPELPVRPENPISALELEKIRRNYLTKGINTNVPGSTDRLKQLINKKETLNVGADSSLSNVGSLDDERAFLGEVGSSRPNVSSSLSGIGEIDLAQEANTTLGDKLAGLDGSSTGEGANKRAELEARIDANKGIIADETRMQQGQLGQDTEEPKSRFQENQDSLQNLFTKSMEEQKQLFGDLSDDTGEKSIEDYKAQFQKATGIDVSGEPDNKMALMSLGLSLMQNKAGKGFDLSNILTSVGEAGEASMPAFQKAKDDARAGQVAAGKYALQQTQADEKTKLALEKEKRLSLSALSKEFRTTAEGRFLNNESHLNKMEQNELTQSIKIRAAMIKAGGDANKVNKSFTVKPVDGQDLEYKKAVKVNVGGKSASIFINPATDVRRFKDAAFNIGRARSNLKDLTNLNSQLLKPGTIPIMAQISGQIKNLGVAFGIPPETLFKDQIISDGKGGFKTVEGVSRANLSQTLRDKIVVEYKRFLTQETGNGISNKDIEKVEKLIGEIKYLTNPADANEKLAQIDGIFQKTENQINNVFKAFRDKDSYGSDYQYNKAMAILDGDEDGKKYTFGNSGKSFNVRTGSDGRMIYSLQKK